MSNRSIRTKQAFVARALLTFSSRDAATLASGLRITPAFLESRRRSQPGGGFFYAA